MSETCKTPAPETTIESVNARIRTAVKARGHFPNEQGALNCACPAVMALVPTGKGRAPLDAEAAGLPERVRHHLQAAALRPRRLPGTTNPVAPSSSQTLC